jgi:hypothetical protein
MSACLWWEEPIIEAEGETHVFAIVDCYGNEGLVGLD